MPERCLIVSSGDGSQIRTFPTVRTQTGAKNVAPKEIDGGGFTGQARLAATCQVWTRLASWCSLRIVIKVRRSLWSQSRSRICCPFLNLAAPQRAPRLPGTREPTSSDGRSPNMAAALVVSLLSTLNPSWSLLCSRNVSCPEPRRPCDNRVAGTKRPSRRRGRLSVYRRF